MQDLGNWQNLRVDATYKAARQSRITSIHSCRRFKVYTLPSQHKTGITFHVLTLHNKSLVCASTILTPFLLSEAAGLNPSSVCKVG